MERDGREHLASEICSYVFCQALFKTFLWFRYKSAEPHQILPEMSPVYEGSDPGSGTLAL